jgi:hypothetical protein
VKIVSLGCSCSAWELIFHCEIFMSSVANLCVNDFQIEMPKKQVFFQSGFKTIGLRRFFFIYLFILFIYYYFFF